VEYIQQNGCVFLGKKYILKRECLK